MEEINKKMSEAIKKKQKEYHTAQVIETRNALKHLDIKKAKTKADLEHLDNKEKEATKYELPISHEIQAKKEELKQELKETQDKIKETKNKFQEEYKNTPCYKKNQHDQDPEKHHISPYENELNKWWHKGTGVMKKTVISTEHGDYVLQCRWCGKILKAKHTDDDEFDACFIATATYGTPQEPKIDILRKYRDLYLPQRITNLYYQNSPPIADWITKHPTARKIVRILLEPTIKIVEQLNAKQ